MPFDAARLHPHLRELDESRVRYDRALAEHAALAARAAAAPEDAALAARLDHAAAALNTARAGVADARRLLDRARLAELAAVSLDQLAQALRPEDVLALFPVSLEAKLDPGRRLRVRIWPDAIATATHEPRLAPFELQAGRRWARANAAAPDEPARRAAWQALAEEVGTTRAAWIARLLEPQPDVVPMLDEEAPFVPRAALLPDRFVVAGVRDGALAFSVLGAPIPFDLATGFDTTPSETRGLTNRDGEPIQLPERMRWLTDFEVAKRVGMALEIALAPNVDHLDALVAFGVRVTEAPSRSAEQLAALFEAHRYSRGLAFVPAETPTNNTRAAGSGLPSPSERIAAGFLLERSPRAFTGAAHTNGTAAAAAFGLDAQTFARVAASGAAPEVELEPEGFEPETARALAAVLFPVTLGPMLEDLAGIDPARADQLRAFFVEHVRPAGPLPALRVGRQPYGVLPVTPLDRFQAEAGEAVDPRLLAVVKAARVWWRSLRLDDIYGGTAEEALRHPGRSTRIYVETVHRTPDAGFSPSLFASVASALARSSRNAITTDWVTPVMRSLRDGVAAPAAAPVVDAATREALAALSRDPPHLILRSAAPTSMLARMARHAALLEWGRFARGVLLANVDHSSQAALQTRAASEGIAAYIRTLHEVMEGRLRPDVAVLPGRLDPVLSPADPRGPRSPIAVPPGRLDPVLSPVGPRDRPVPFPVPPIVIQPEPPGTPEIGPAERARVSSAVGQLLDPLPSAPGADRLRAFRGALAFLARIPEARLEPAFFGVLDAATHRIDAWVTSLAEARLHTVRARAPGGVAIGAWGYLQDVAPATPGDQAEHIHAPSLDQAAAAAVLRSAALRAGAAQSGHADIDLSSRRVRLARWLLEGLRNGRSLGELLGLRFERALKGSPGGAHLGALRRAFAASGGRAALDGLLLEHARPWDAAERPRTSELPAKSSPAGAAISAALGTVEEALDALADALTAEAVYQLVRGNPAGALADLESLARGEAPPPPRLEVTETPPSSARLLHRVLIALPEGARAPGWPPDATPRARAEPLLDTWCGLVLGSADQTVLTVDGAGSSVALVLSALGLSAIDLVLAKDGEILERARAAARALRPALGAASVRRDRACGDLLRLCAAAKKVLSRAEPLSAHNLELREPLAPSAAEDSGDLQLRADRAHAALTAVHGALLAPADPAGSGSSAAAAVRAAAFGLHVPGALALAEVPRATLDELAAAARSRLDAAARATNARDKLSEVFGRELPGVVSFLPPDPAVLATAAAPPPALFGDERALPAAWLDAIGRVRPGASRLAELLRAVEITRGGSPDALRVAQAPYAEGDRWIATRLENALGAERPRGRLSLLIHAPLGVDPARRLGGLLIDAWSEPLPAAVRDTALALRFNAPNTRAPQSILLAVCPNLAQGWSAELLTSTILDTMELARMRMTPPGTITRSGHRPLVWLGQRADGSGVSFPL